LQYSYISHFGSTHEMIRQAGALFGRMQITISFRSGFDVSGVVLAKTGTRLRVAMQNWDDAAEFYCRQGQWFLGNGDPVRIVWPPTSAGRFYSFTSPGWLN